MNDDSRPPAALVTGGGTGLGKTTAEVFAAAFMSLGRFRGQCSPQAWLFGIARRKIADSLRRSVRRREISASEAGELTQGASSSAENVITWFKLRDIFTDSFNCPSKVNS